MATLPVVIVGAGIVGVSCAREQTDRFAVRTPGGRGASAVGPMRYGPPGGMRSLVADLAGADRLA